MLSLLVELIGILRYSVKFLNLSLQIIFILLTFIISRFKYIYIYIYSIGMPFYNCSGRSVGYFVINVIPTYLRGNMTSFS